MITATPTIVRNYLLRALLCIGGAFGVCGCSIVGSTPRVASLAVSPRHETATCTWSKIGDSPPVYESTDTNRASYFLTLLEECGESRPVRAISRVRSMFVGMKIDLLQRLPSPQGGSGRQNDSARQTFSGQGRFENNDLVFLVITEDTPELCGRTAVLWRSLAGGSTESALAALLQCEDDIIPLLRVAIAER